MVEAAMATLGFFRRWTEYRQLIGKLKSYPDVELAELGMVRSACAQTAFDATFRSALGDLRRWLRSWRKHRQTCNRLMRLSERQLEDIGIDRMDISGAHARHGRHVPQESPALRLDRIPIIR
jgi:uncharacterized protein YjiS (DUF1127 family)